MRLFLWLLACSAIAAPPSSELLFNATGQNQAFAAIGRLRAKGSCTAFLIEPDSAYSASPAYALTAGHCVSREPYGVIRGEPAGFTIDFNYFADTREAFVQVRASTVVWSTMKGTDLALLQLDSTLGDLQARGLRGFRLFAEPLPEGAALFWAGAPSVNIPAGHAFLRRGSCSSLGSATLIEGNWLWRGEIRNNCPDVYGGASGSPLLDAASGKVAGIIGTTTNLSTKGGPDFDCFENRPCAVTPAGPVVEADTSYAAPVAPLAGCFDFSGRADPTLPGCGLDPGVQLDVDLSGRTAAPPLTSGETSHWNARLSGSLPYYAFKSFRLGLGDCADAAGYSRPILLSETPAIRSFIDREEGHYLLCVVAGPSASIGASWQEFRFASVRRMRIDSHPPAVPPDFKLDPTGSGYHLAIGPVPPAVATLQYKSGPPGSLDCTDTRGYRDYLSVPILVQQADFPQRLCIRYADDAGNAAAPLVFYFNHPVIQPFGLRNGASLERARAFAPGSLFRVDGIELTAQGVPQLRLTDARGQIHDLTITGLQTTFLEGRLPEDLPFGWARLELLPVTGLPTAFDISVVPAAPGFFRAVFSEMGPPLGYFASPSLAASPLAECGSGPIDCDYVPVAVGPEGTDVVLFGTGLARDLVSVSLGTDAVPVISSRPVPEWPGVDELRLRLPPDFRLRGFQRLQAGSAGIWMLLDLDP